MDKKEKNKNLKRKIERIEKMREKYNKPYDSKKKKDEYKQENKIYTNNVIEFRKRN